MAKLLKLRRGTTSQHSSFTGAEGEVTVDTDKEALVVHNGSTAGGFPVARADGTGVANFTITGELDAATLDISGNADIDGTLEADAITVDGTALNEYISDTVGAMVGSNTETGIAVTYVDDDNTLDFAITSIPGVTFTGDVTFDNQSTGGRDIIWDESDDALEFLDNTKATFGNDADLKIYHNGTDNYIMPSNGKLIINNGSENLAQFISNGAVELYHDNTKRFETTSYGGHVLGVSTNTDVGYAASQVFEINNSSDANNNHTALSFTFAAQDRGAAIYAAYRGTAGEAEIILAPEYNEKAAVFKPHGAVELNYDNAKKLETTNTGVTVTGTLAATALTGDGSALTGIVSFVSGMILIWSGAANAIPSGWVLCNGSNSTPDLRNRFVVGAGDTFSVGATGGATSITIAETNLPSHSHSFSANATSGATTANHTHGSGNYAAASDGSHTHSLSGNTSNTGNHTHQQNKTENYLGQGPFNGTGRQRHGSTGNTVVDTDSNGAHSHSLSGNAASGGSHTHSLSGDSASGGASPTHSVSVSGNTGNAGSGNAIGTLPPYYALCYIMKS